MMVALGSRGMTEEAAGQCAKDMKKWKALVHMYSFYSLTRPF